MSTFVSQVHNELSLNLPLPSTAPASPAIPGAASTSQSKQALREYFLNLQPPTSLDATQKHLRSIHAFKAERALVRTPGGEEDALWVAIAAKLSVGIYTQLLDVYLGEASEAEGELEWWADVERSRWRAAYFLLQTLPIRVISLSQTVFVTIRARNLPLDLSLFTPRTLRQLFPSRSILRPSTLTLAFFPHLTHASYSASLLSRPKASAPLRRPGHVSTFSVSSAGSTGEHVANALREILNLPGYWASSVLHAADLPIRLARHECDYKTKELARIRDERAEVLGALLGLKDTLDAALQTNSELNGNSDSVRLALQAFCARCAYVLEPPFPGDNESTSVLAAGERDVLEQLDTFANVLLPQHLSEHTMRIQSRGLKRPSRLTLVWPQLVFLPPLALYGIKLAYTSRASLEQVARDAVETVIGFWNDWLLGPLKDVVKTVRAGSDDGVIITKESVKADLDSLERMALSLARDKLNYTPSQMAALSAQLRAGDLTAVMQIYEDDIRSPLRSAVGGTLLRTLLVQVQKAKVDIDQALSGIDKLLKSQELTFAFVGVAPALAVVYALAGWARGVWKGRSGEGRLGGRKRRMGTWAAIRRIERLLLLTSSPATSSPQPTSQPSPPSSPSSTPTTTPIPARTLGLLLLSTTTLRSYALSSLPAHSRLRAGFLEDVADLEDPTLGRAEKLEVIARMWRSWGGVLGWTEVGGGR